MFKTPFRAFSTSGRALTGYKKWHRTRVSSPQTTPSDDTSNGYIIEAQFRAKSSDAAASTSAAQLASAKEPNKSAPIPAISPTLSPTLSAMHAGFLGSSSSIPMSFFPDKSAPTSAAL